jgi:beta-lactamase family protein
MTGDQLSRRSALGLMGAVPLAAGVPAAPRISQEYGRFLKKLGDEDQFSGTVLVAHRGRTVFTRSYGMADKDRSIPNRTDTIFNLASGAKPLTGLAVVQLAERRRIRRTPGEDWLTNERIAHPYIYQTSDGSRVDGVRNLDAGSTINGGFGSNSARAFIGSGGGGGFATAPDLVRFALALSGGKLLCRPFHEL